MKSTDLRAKARAIFGSAIAEPMPNQPNGAKALQQRANARPIPTYKDGGAIKKLPTKLPRKDESGIRKLPKKLPNKDDSGIKMLSPEALNRNPAVKTTKPANAPKPIDMLSKEELNRNPAAKRFNTVPKPPKSGPEADDVLITTRRGQQMLDAQKRREMEMDAERRKKQSAADRLLGIPMKKDGGKISEFEKAFASARKEGKKTFDYSGKSYTTEVRGEKKKNFGDAFAEARKAGKKTFDFGGKSYSTNMANEGSKPAPAAKAESKVDTRFVSKSGKAPLRAAAPKAEEKSDSMLTKIGRLYTPGAKDRPLLMVGEEARRENKKMGTIGGMRSGGKACGGAYKKGGKVQTSSDTARKLATEMGGMKKGGKAKDGLAVMIAIGKVKKPVKKAVGGAGKTRKGMAPIKKAQGGAAKVRKGMMSPTGDIKQVVKPKKGLGGM